MELTAIEKNIKIGKIVTDIYSGNYKCKCGKKLKLEDLNYGGFGTSLSCSCGDGFWITEEDDELRELLVYEGYEYLIEEHFVVAKQRVYSGIDWRKKRLNSSGLREETEYLYIDFKGRKMAAIDSNGTVIRNGVHLFFKNINMEDMQNISKEAMKYCSENEIIPNYGFILTKLTSFYNSVDYENTFRKVLSEYYIESFVKEDLHYLFNCNFLFDLDILENRIALNKNGTTASKILGVPKKIISYIRENKLNDIKIKALQSFFKVGNYYDFQILILKEDTIFDIENLSKLAKLLEQGYSAVRLNNYAREIMIEEGLSKDEFLTYLIDSLRMSRTGDLEFKLYGKRLKERHDELMTKYALVKDEAINDKILEVHNTTEINQYGEEYLAIVPSSVHDFEEEGKNQKHCVLSYIESAANRETLIVFVRRKSELKKSYITLEIQNNRIVQARKFANIAVNNEEKKYLEGLASANGWYY